MTEHFYIHIPFCNQKCPYCKFALTPVFDEFKKRRYIEYLKKEIRGYFQGSQAMYLTQSTEKSGFWFSSLCEFCISVDEIFDRIWNCLSGASFSNSKNESNTNIKMKHGRFRKLLLLLVSKVKKCIRFFVIFCQKVRGRILRKIEDPEIHSGSQRTIYFGGGTPSILSHPEIREILECFSFYNQIRTEVTLESNPEDINQEYVEGLIDLGINRLSMGVQTLNDKSLTEIHRSDSASIISALEGIGEALSNTENISVNIDFILGLPYTLPGEIFQSIKTLHTQFPFITHTSVYMLEDENYPKHWKSNSITENEMQAEFIAIMDYFQSIGWNHYELSNFAKKGYESVHNRAYWNHSNSRGFGLSAASYENGTRWNNASSFGKYYEGTRENEEILTNEQKEIETMMFGLRTNGFDIQNTKLDISAKKIQENREKGFLEIENNMIKPTKTGIFILDHIMSELISS